MARRGNFGDSNGDLSLLLRMPQAAASAITTQAATRMTGLTPRQRQVMAMILMGQPGRNIAADLGVSQRSVENHRASIMKKAGSKSLPALARLALASAPI